MHDITHECALAILTGLAPSPLIGPLDPRLGADALPQVDEVRRTTTVVRTARYHHARGLHLAARFPNEPDRVRAASEIGARQAHGLRLRDLLAGLRLRTGTTNRRNG